MATVTKGKFAAYLKQLWTDGDWVRQLQSGNTIALTPEQQQAILAGFRAHYAKNSPKWPAVLAAVRVEFRLNATRRHGTFVLLDASNAGITVSYKCPPYDPLKGISHACRGAVHYSQILAQKKRQCTEMDHVNEGGMAGLIRRWLASLPLTIEQVATHIQQNDAMKRASAIHGFVSFREPLLSQWQGYHRQHAVLEEVTPEQHRKRTKARRR
jgi:hypothetical protein